jgi:hypothetical protein
VLALMVAPAGRSGESAAASPTRARLGTFGFYEAIDYTPSRLPRGEKSAVVRSFMAHHQGMGLLALAYLLLDRPMQRRFESDPATWLRRCCCCRSACRARCRSTRRCAERVDFRSGQPEHRNAAGGCIVTPDTARPKCSCCPTAATT